MKKFLPIYILLAAVLISFLLVTFKPKPEKLESPRLITPVEYITAIAKDTRILIESEGILKPKIESALNAEISGTIIALGENFYPGKYFEKGEMLFKIEPLDYEDRLRIAEFELAQADLYLEEQTALAEQAQLDWDKFDFGEANDLVLRKPQLKGAVTRHASALASVNLAQRNLAKTTFQAPYSGFLLSRSIDLGSSVNGATMTPQAQAYAAGDGEVRLPIDEDEQKLLDLNTNPVQQVRFYHSSTQSLIAQGYIERVEATLDSQNRLSYCVGLIKNAFPAPSQSSDRENLNDFKKPFQRNQFLLAEIEGGIVRDAFTVPDIALRKDRFVYTINEDNRLSQKEVRIIHRTQDSVIIDLGVDTGDKIVISPIPYFVENMLVEPIELP